MMFVGVFGLLIGFAAAVASAVPQGRLVGADVAAPGQFPWQVSLRWTSSFSHTCGGTIVTPEHVVTAAHCIANNEPTPHNPNEMFVVTGHVSNVHGGRASGISEIRMHPEYAPAETWRNDIAVIKLSNPIEVNALELPVPIGDIYVNGSVTCLISGWGRVHFPSLGLPSQLQTQTVTAITVDQCRSIWGNSIFNTTLCTLPPVGQGVCSGDSGGPLVCEGQLAGVVSWGNPCANGFPDGFARVSMYEDWLKENTADLSPLGLMYMKKVDAIRASLDKSQF